jgi:hypothetical protein
MIRMQALAIGPSRGKAVLMLLASLAFVAGGIFILVAARADERPRRGVPAAVAGWGAIVFFGGCAMVGVWQLVDSRPRLVIDEQGITDRTLRCGRIPWREIVDARVNVVHGQPFICLELRNEEPFLRKLSPAGRALLKANRALGFSALNINLGGLDADPHEVYELVLRLILAARVE